MKIFCTLLMALVWPTVNSSAQDRYVSVLGGFAALSGDAATEFLQQTPRVSLYDPKNGPAVNVVGGIHLNDWVSLQGNYISNRNDVTLTEVRGAAFLQRKSKTRQNAAGADALLYFRPRSSSIRPYLSVGIAAVHISVEETASNWHPGLRVAVGIDLMTRNGWGFRYSFSEMLTKNAFNELVSPSGRRSLMNFQNLFGFVKYF